MKISQLTKNDFFESGGEDKFSNEVETARVHSNQCDRRRRRSGRTHAAAFRRPAATKVEKK